MRSKKFLFPFVFSLVAILSISTMVLAGGGDKKKKQKRPKNTGIISVKTTPNALTVKIDGQDVGQSGVTEGAEFYLTPGIHVVEIEAPGMPPYRKEINVVKNVKNCICLTVLEKTTKRPCPYDMKISGPSSIEEGQLATFFTTNVATVPIGNSILNYAWKVNPSTARITSGLGTGSITVDTSGLGGQTLSVEVDTGDGVYDASCRQTKSIDTEVSRIPPPPIVKPDPISCDVFSSVAPDDDKARFDNCIIQLNTNPSTSLYIIINQGTDRLSLRRNTYDQVRKRASDYFIQRGISSNRISIVRGRDKATTTYQIWLIPIGADLPEDN
jgi:hypothetical protein